MAVVHSNILLTELMAAHVSGTNRRNRSLQVFESTEKEFVDTLLLIVEKFMRPYQGSKLIGHADSKIIFSEIVCSCLVVSSHLNNGHSFSVSPLAMARVCVAPPMVLSSLQHPSQRWVFAREL